MLRPVEDQMMCSASEPISDKIEEEEKTEEVGVESSSSTDSEIEDENKPLPQF